MFWDQYCALCKERNISPTTAGVELGVSGNAVFKWRKGAEPHGETLDKIAKYFGCTVSYLLGYADTPTPPPPEKEKTPAPEEDDPLAGLTEENRAKVVEYIELLRGSQEN